MKKIKRILVGSLTALSFMGGFKTKARDNDANNFQIQTISDNFDQNSANLLDNKFLNKNNIIRAAIGIATLGSIYYFGGEGIYNALFMNSNKNLYYKSYKETEVNEKEKELLRKRSNQGFERIECKTNFGTLHGFARFPKNINAQDVKKIILVCGSTSELSCVSIKFAVDRSSEEDQKNSIFICFDYPTYAKSEGPKLNQKVMQQYAKSVSDYAKKLKNNEYKNVEFSVYGYSLGGIPASYLTTKKEFDIREASFWSPAQFDGAVQGITGLRCLGILGRYWKFNGEAIDSIENIKNSHENCKINLFSGSLDSGDFLSLETTVLKTKKYKNKNHDENWEENIAREVWKKLEKEGKNNLGNRLTVSFLGKAGHCDHDFYNSVWNLKSIWNYEKESKLK